MSTGVVVGSIVHFVPELRGEDTHLAAIVTKLTDVGEDVVNLFVFPDGAAQAQPASEESVPYAAVDRQTGKWPAKSWHWPREKVL